MMRKKERTKSEEIPSHFLLDEIINEKQLSINNYSLLNAILTELAFIDSDLYKSLNWILQNDIGDDGSLLCITFSITKEKKNFQQENEIVDKIEKNKIHQNEKKKEEIEEEIELIENGQNIYVTNKNKILYVFLKARYRCRLRVAMEIDALIDGFCMDMGISQKDIAIFSNFEFHSLLNGRSLIDIDEIRAFSKYQNCEANHIVILWFWQFMHQSTHLDVSLLLKFVTGSSKFPLDGFSPLFTLTLDYDKFNALPTAHTCFNQLVLPIYSDYTTLNKKILLAIHNSDSFEMT